MSNHPSMVMSYMVPPPDYASEPMRPLVPFKAFEGVLWCEPEVAKRLSAIEERLAAIEARLAKRKAKRSKNVNK